MAGRVTLREIAQQAGVSTSLVSLILRNKGRASDEVRSRVIAHLEKAGYQPKYLRKTFYFIIDLPQVIQAGKTVSVMRQLQGMERTFADTGAPLQVEFVKIGANASPAALEAALLPIADKRPGGVLLGTDIGWLDAGLAFFADRRTPVMQLGYDTENSAHDATVVDSFSGAYLATKHLADKGHTRIATIRWQAGLAGINSNKKHAGFTAAIADARLKLPAEYVVSLAAAQDESGWTSARDLVAGLLKLRQPPTALFVENSFVSLSLIYPMADDRGSLPKQIATLDMVHFEDWPLDPVEDIMAGKLFFPPRDTVLVTIDWEEIGAMAARMIMERVKGNLPDSGRVVRVNPTLQKVRGSAREPVTNR